MVGGDYGRRRWPEHLWRSTWGRSARVAQKKGSRKSSGPRGAKDSVGSGSDWTIRSCVLRDRSPSGSSCTQFTKRWPASMPTHSVSRSAETCRSTLQMQTLPRDRLCLCESARATYRPSTDCDERCRSVARRLVLARRENIPTTFWGQERFFRVRVTAKCIAPAQESAQQSCPPTTQAGSHARPAWLC